jgi:hypothetical protein
MPQTLEFNAPTGLTISCKLFAVGSDTVAATESATEKTNDKNRYAVTVDVAAGSYRLNGFVGSDGGFVNEIYDLTAATATFYPRSETKTASSAEVEAISGFVLAPSPSIERAYGDTDAIRFTWPVDGATITGEVSKAGGSYAAVTGAITQRADEGGKFWYQLAYNSADRQTGSQRYKFTDGTYIRYINLFVNPAGGLDAAETQAAAAAALTAYDPPTKAELDLAQSSIESSCATVNIADVTDAVRVELATELGQIDDIAQTITLVINQAPMDAI